MSTLNAGNDLAGSLFSLITNRRSIRKYKTKSVSGDDMLKIVEAGLHAPNAGGRQSAYIVAINDPELCTRIGKMNFSTFDRSRLKGSYVSREQPSIIDDQAIRNAFYGAPAVCAIFVPQNFLYSIPDAFCCAENMVLMAAAMNMASCIIARGAETFANNRHLLDEWGVPADYEGCCFVILGCRAGPEPSPKKIRDGRFKIISSPQNI